MEDLSGMELKTETAQLKQIWKESITYLTHLKTDKNTCNVKKIPL